MTQTSWPAHDPATRRWLPESSTPVDPGRVESLLAAEWDKFAANTPASADHNRRASKTLPLGVTPPSSIGIPTRSPSSRRAGLG